MSKVALATVALALMTVPQLLEAQQRGGRGGFGLQQQNQVALVLQQADSLQLNLTAEQTTRLEAISEELDETTAADREAMTGLLGAAGGGGGRGAFEEIMPLLQSIQAANDAAMTTVRDEVLNAEQTATVNVYLQSLAAGRGRRGGGPPGGG